MKSDLSIPLTEPGLRVSKRKRKQLLEQQRVDLFGPDGLQITRDTRTKREKIESQIKQADDFLAKGWITERAHKKRVALHLKELEQLK